MDVSIPVLVLGDSGLELPDLPYAEEPDRFDVLVMFIEGNTTIRDQLMKEADWDPRWVLSDLIYLVPLLEFSPLPYNYAWHVLQVAHNFIDG